MLRIIITCSTIFIVSNWCVSCTSVERYRQSTSYNNDAFYKESTRNKAPFYSQSEKNNLSVYTVGSRNDSPYFVEVPVVNETEIQSVSLRVEPVSVPNNEQSLTADQSNQAYWKNSNLESTVSEPIKKVRSRNRKSSTLIACKEEYADLFLACSKR